MILVDTSIWIDHLHRAEPKLITLLEDIGLCTHPMVIGELALGSIRDRDAVLQLLADMPGTPLATHDEVLELVNAHTLHGVGLSLVDAHLLAAARLSRTVLLWTRDRQLRGAAERLGVLAASLA